MTQSGHIGLRSNSIFPPPCRTLRALPKPSVRMNKPYYCDYAGVPTIVGETRAWSFVEGAWKEISHTEAYTKARLIGEHEFDNFLVNCHRCTRRNRADECLLSGAKQTVEPQNVR